jgi:hypothetical protein
MVLMAGCGDSANMMAGIDAPSRDAALIDAATIDAPLVDGAPDGAEPETGVQVWVIYDSNAMQADLEGELPCLIRNTNFNDIVDSYNSSPYGGLRVRWGGVMTTSQPNVCGVLYGPDAQCLTNLVANNPNLRAPTNGDVFLYVLHDANVQCGGGNNNGVTHGDGELVQTANGQIHVYTGTIADGWGYNPCQQRVAVHELFESVTEVNAADCCTGQTPGNLCDDCVQACAQYTTVGPAGYGSYTLSCPNGRTYASQMVERWQQGVYPPWQTWGCVAAQ